jgi:Uma2 family endonuclease
MSAVAPPDITARDLAARVGAVPLWRIRMDDPAPGAATEEDVERIRCKEDRLYELIDGILVEKAVSEETSIVAGVLITFLNNFVIPRKLGWVLAPDGFYRLLRTRLRAPDVSFVRRQQRRRGRPIRKGYADKAPALAIEVFSPGNTVSELEQKREEFFAAGTELFWIVHPQRQEIEVSTDPHTHRTLRRGDILDGGTVLPGFSLNVGDLFDAIDLDRPEA